MSKIKITFFIIIIFFLIEFASQSIILLFGEKKYSLIFKPFSNQISKITTNYEISWDYKNNKMKPGNYLTDKGVSYKINSKGFRGEEFKTIKEKKRIIAFGGSTTIGLESPDNLTYPAQLEKILNKKNLDYEVLNMGFGSKSINYIKNLFFNEAYKYDPDIILIYNNRNSILYDGGYIDPPKLSTQFLRWNYYLQENIMTYRIMLKIYKRVLNYSLNSNYLKSPFGSKGISEDYLRTGYTNSLIEIIEFAEQKKIEVILIKQAYLFDIKIMQELDKFTVDELIEFYKQDYFLKKFNLNETVNFWSILGTILNKKIEELKIYKNVVIVDPRKNLTSSQQNFTDYLHLTPKGNSVLAYEISKKID